MQSLLDELNALSLRNDELMNEREQDAQGMNEMESKVEEYKRKWEAARIELRNLKGESRMQSGVRDSCRSADTFQPPRRCSYRSRFLMIIFLPRPTAILPMLTFLRSKLPSMASWRLLGQSCYCNHSYTH